jgi:hypothetical protein
VEEVSTHETRSGQKTKQRKRSRIQPKAVLLKEYVKEYGGDSVFTTDGKTLFCILCHCTVSFGRAFCVQQHVGTKKHQTALEELSTSRSRQKTLVDLCGSSTEQTQFNTELCETLIVADIPFNKMQNETFKRFLEKFTNFKVPDRSTLCKGYIADLYEKKLSRIRTELAECPIYVEVDETTDSTGRYVANVLVGALKSDEASKPYLIKTEFLERTNHATILKLVNDSMILLWPNGIRYLNN